MPGERIDHEQRFARSRDGRHRLHLVHQRLINMEAARSIKQQHIDRLQLGRVQRAGGDLNRSLTRHNRQRGNSGLLAQHFQLFLRSRTIHVERRHQHLFAARFAQQLADLGGAGGLARTLQADHHDHNRRRGIEIEVCRFRTQHLDQPIVDDLDNLLARSDRTQDLLADGGFGDRIDKPADDGKRHVGFEQRDPHFAHRGLHILLAQRAAATQPIKNAAKPV